VGTKRTKIERPAAQQITPAAIAAYRRMLVAEAKHTCPDGPPPYPGQVYDSRNPEHIERERRYRIEQAAFDAQRAACRACRASEAAHAALLAALGIVLKPWQSGIEDFPAVIDALDAAIGNGEQ
jgi:hypothetical protein